MYCTFKQLGPVLGSDMEATLPIDNGASIDGVIEKATRREPVTIPGKSLHSAAHGMYQNTRVSLAFNVFFWLYS